MAWIETQTKVWGVCWKWRVPYPCRKIVTRYCCTGTHKYKTWGAVLTENYFCCDGNEHHWWSFKPLINIKSWVIETNKQVCKKSIPKETEGCPNIIDTVPDPGIE